VRHERLGDLQGREHVDPKRHSVAFGVGDLPRKRMNLLSLCAVSVNPIGAVATRNIIV